MAWDYNKVVAPTFNYQSNGVKTWYVISIAGVTDLTAIQPFITFS